MNKILEQHFLQPTCVGALPVDAFNVGMGQAGSPEMFEIVVCTIEVNQTGLIVNAKFKAFGNAYTIACADWLMGYIQGQSLTTCMRLDYELSQSILELPLIKRPSIIIVLEALQAAIANYQEKSQ